MSLRAAEDWRQMRHRLIARGICRPRATYSKRTRSPWRVCLCANSSRSISIRIQLSLWSIMTRVWAHATSYKTIFWHPSAVAARDTIPNPASNTAQCPIARPQCRTPARETLNKNRGTQLATQVMCSHASPTQIWSKTRLKSATNRHPRIDSRKAAPRWPLFYANLWMLMLDKIILELPGNWQIIIQLPHQIVMSQRIAGQ